mmetsp:Transcript_12162/g.29054  ORF Transcript_12162/g.29054 Transcript_12162/m.29054 type:complete len:271 (-) Transcript_12162:118-930(-)
MPRESHIQIRSSANVLDPETWGRPTRPVCVMGLVESHNALVPQQLGMNDHLWWKPLLLHVGNLVAGLCVHDLCHVADLHAIRDFVVSCHCCLQGLGLRRLRRLRRPRRLRTPRDDTGCLRLHFLEDVVGSLASELLLQELEVLQKLLLILAFLACLQESNVLGLALIQALQAMVLAVQARDLFFEGLHSYVALLSFITRVRLRANGRSCFRPVLLGDVIHVPVNFIFPFAFWRGPHGQGRLAVQEVIGADGNQALTRRLPAFLLDLQLGV